MKAAIIIPVFNQLHYTRQCLESLHAAGGEEFEIVIVDNGSTDGTADYLSGWPHLNAIRNRKNCGCAGAWNQAVKASRAKWKVVLNNDVLVSDGWLNALINTAELNKLDIVSPAICDGELNYDLRAYACEFVRKMAGVFRPGVVNGVCFMVHQSVFGQIGFFDENFRIGGFEDADFFLRARQAGFKLRTTGCSYIHHFGSVTQKAIKAATGDFGPEHRAYFREKWRLSWLKRRWIRARQQFTRTWWAAKERWRYGHSLNEKRISGAVRYE